MKPPAPRATEGTRLPAQGTRPLAEGTRPPAEGTRPPAGGTRPPAGAANPPADGSGPSAEGIRVSKLLTERGLASRREADEWIAAGWVRVRGRPVVLGQRVAADEPIEIDPRAQREQARQVTVLLHKPLGYVSGQPEDGHAAAVSLVTAASRWRDDRAPLAFHPGQLRGLAPAGRLDIDSTGLLVLTQDGRVAKALIGERSPIEKEYLVRVTDGSLGSLGSLGTPAAKPALRVPPEVLARLRHGLELDGRALLPAKVSWQNEDQLRIVLREGRKRQIRRMCEAVGLQVLGLKRVRIGSVVLGALPAGQWRYLGVHERF